MEDKFVWPDSLHRNFPALSESIGWKSVWDKRWQTRSWMKSETAPLFRTMPSKLYDDTQTEIAIALAEALHE